MNEGITRHRTAVDTPSKMELQNAWTKRYRSSTKFMLLDTELSQEFYVEVVYIACYLVNRSLSIATECKTPKEVWYNIPSNYYVLRIFGSPVYAHIKN